MPTQVGYDGKGKFYRWGNSGKKYYTEKHGEIEAKALADKQGKAIYGSGYEKNDLEILKSNNAIIEICDAEEIKDKKPAGRSKLSMIAHEIYPNEEQWNSNGLTWLEEYVIDNMDSAIGMPMVVDFIDKDLKDTPSGHGEMYFNEEGEVCFVGESVGSVYEVYIADVEINNEIKRALIVDSWIYKQRYDNFINYLKEEKENSTIYGSVEINGKSDSKKIEYANSYLNEDGSKKNGRQPRVFDYTGLAILSQIVEPADKTSQLLEINTEDSTEKNNKQEGETKMENKELIAKVEELSSQLTELNSKIEELTTANTEKETIIAEKEAKILELNEVIVGVNKDMEELNSKNSTMESELNSYREEKEKAEAEAKKLEVNNYFNNEVIKNNFEEEELNSLKKYVEEVNLEGLKNAEAELIVKKVKAERVKAETEVNNKKEEKTEETNIFFYTKEEESKDDEIRFFNN